MKTNKVDRKRRLEITMTIENELATHCRLCVNVGNDAINCGGCVTLIELRALGVALGSSDLKPRADLTIEQRKLAAANGIDEKTAIMRIKRGMTADDAVTKPLTNKPWKSKDDEILLALRKEGISYTTIAEKIGRTTAGTKSRWDRLTKEEGQCIGK